MCASSIVKVAVERNELTKSITEVMPMGTKLNKVPANEAELKELLQDIYITAKKNDLLRKLFGFISQNTFCHCHHLENIIA